MRRAWLTILSLLLSLSLLWGCTSAPPVRTSQRSTTPRPTGCPACVLSPAAMPKSWQPRGQVDKGLSAAPWSASEAQDATYAIRTGVQEMIDLYARRPSAVPALQDDAVGSLIEVTYGGVNQQALDVTARNAARRHLMMLMSPYLERGPKSVTCDDYERLLPLTIYAMSTSSHLRTKSDGLGTDASRAAALVPITNAAYRECGSLNEAMGYDYQATLKSRNAATEEVFDLVIWSLLFVEAQLVPGLDVPAEQRDFPNALWRYLQSYPLVGASAYRDGAWDEKFIDTAYLATHIAYIPTGNHRNPLYLQDSPNLYRFLRENFYPVLQMGELDLVAEFVDSLRQYGATADNDLQVRDGTRYLLKVFHAVGDRWMNYREPGETTDEMDDYDFIHKAWTGISGVRVRAVEPPGQGTYGSVVRRWLPQPR
jgi:hypothetical protein